MRIAIIGNGDFFDFSHLLEADDYIIAADGGANHCLKLKIKPHIIIGDFDSITNQTRDFFADIEQIRITSQFDTDLEKIFRYIEKKFKAEKIDQIKIITCSSQQRLDHSLFNFLLVYKINKPVIFFSKYYWAKIISSSQKETLLGISGQTISLLPIFGPVQGLKLQGFKWNLDGQKDLTYSLSNLVNSERAEISITKGKILLIINNKL